MVFNQYRGEVACLPVPVGEPGRIREFLHAVGEVHVISGKDKSPRDVSCRRKLLINEPALDKLQALRDRLGKPLIVRSAYRSPEHNRAVGGASRSKHLDGAAFDIAMTNHDPVVFAAAAREVGFLGFGFYPRSGFMHVDLGPARQWGELYARSRRLSGVS